MEILEIANYLSAQLRVGQSGGLLTLLEPRRGKHLLCCQSGLRVFSKHVDQEFLALDAALVPNGAYVRQEVLLNYSGCRRMRSMISFSFRPEKGGPPESIT